MYGLARLFVFGRAGFEAVAQLVERRWFRRGGYEIRLPPKVVGSIPTRLAFVFTPTFERPVMFAWLFGVNRDTHDEIVAAYKVAADAKDRYISDLRGDVTQLQSQLAKLAVASPNAATTKHTHIITDRGREFGVVKTSKSIGVDDAGKKWALYIERGRNGYSIRKA